MFWIIICTTSLFLLAYSYVLYPLYVKWAAFGKPLSTADEAYLPDVSIITAVYNEENVLDEKIRTLEALDYPKDKLHIYLGSDLSTDRSNEMLESFERTNDHVTFVSFSERQGKIGVINNLGQRVLEERGKRDDHVLFYNDANVMLTPQILRVMMKHFSDDRIALVDANMRSRKTRKEGISLAEKAYISSEVRLKHNEGRAWGMLQGAFGGCYGLRSTFHSYVPNGFLVDDFYISFLAMAAGGRAINDLDAECFESASHDIWQEYKRKSRISAGNFQNLKYFIQNRKTIPPMLWFCFLSHKVIRWTGPLLLLMSAIGALGWWYAEPGVLSGTILAGILAIFIVIPLMDVVLLNFGIHMGIFRKVRYFLLMNIALFKGFIRYAKGIRTSFWDPPVRE